MPLGIVSDDVFEKEVELIHKNIERGRGPTKQIPEVIREEIAKDKIEGGKGSDIAEAYGVSESSVAAYSNDATSTTTYNEPNTKLQKANDKVRENIIGKARSRLLLALDSITPEKIQEAKLRDLGSIARDMHSIVKESEPTVSNNNSGVQFIFHVPQPKKEQDYEVIDVTS